MAIRDLRSLSVALEPKMSAITPKADIRQAIWNVRKVSESRYPIERASVIIGKRSSSN